MPRGTGVASELLLDRSGILFVLVTQPSLEVGTLDLGSHKYKTIWRIKDDSHVLTVLDTNPSGGVWIGSMRRTGGDSYVELFSATGRRVKTLPIPVEFQPDRISGNVLGSDLVFFSDKGVLAIMSLISGKAKVESLPAYSDYSEYSFFAQNGFIAILGSSEIAIGRASIPFAHRTVRGTFSDPQIYNAHFSESGDLQVWNVAGELLRLSSDGQTARCRIGHVGLGIRSFSSAANGDWVITSDGRISLYNRGCLRGPSYIPRYYSDPIDILTEPHQGSLLFISRKRNAIVEVSPP